jgi:hypothetical protein
MWGQWRFAFSVAKKKRQSNDILGALFFIDLK